MLEKNEIYCNHLSDHVRRTRIEMILPEYHSKIIKRPEHISHVPESLMVLYDPMILLQIIY